MLLIHQAINAIGELVLALTIYALLDCARTPDAKSASTVGWAFSSRRSNAPG